MQDITYYATVVNTTDNRNLSLVGTFGEFGNAGFDNWVRTSLYYEQGEEIKFLDVESFEYRDLTSEEHQKFLLVKLSAVPVAQADL